MKSGIRVFSERGYSAKGNLLPYDEFVLNLDLPRDARINDEVGAHYVEKAEEYLTKEIPLLPLSLYREFKLTGVRSNFEKYHHGRRDMLFYMTLAEAYERQGRFVEKICDVLWAILEETSWVIPAHYGYYPLNPEQQIPENYREDQMPGLDLYASTTASIVALTSLLLKNELDAISPAIRKRINHEVYLRDVRPFVTMPFYWSGEFGNGNVNNWVTHIVSGTLFAAAICTEDYELRCRVVDKAMRYLDNFTAHYPADGYCDEGPGYWSAAGGAYFDSLETIEDMSGGKITVYDSPIVKNMGEYIANFNIDGNWFLNFADCHPHLEADGKMIMRYGKKCDSEELYSFGKMAECGTPLNKYYFFGRPYRVYKDSLFPEVHEAEKVLGKTEVWYEGNKIAIFREFSDTSRGLYLAAKGGHNRESHNHNDVGCLVVYSNGKPIIVDPSHGSYNNGFFGKTRYLRWYMKSSYHSVPLVNGIEESDGADMKSSDEVFDGETKTVSMELKDAFPKEAGILSMKRTCHMGEGFVTVTDSVKCEDVSEICFNYLTVDEPRIIENGRLQIADGRTFEFDPTGLDTVIEKVENTLLPYEDLDIRWKWGRDCLWRIVLKANATEKTVTVTIK